MTEQETGPTSAPVASRRQWLGNARGTLLAYIDALWAGRLAAPSPLEPVYSEKLALAARMVSCLWTKGPSTELTELIREENRRFARELLATDEGRAARSAFNALARAVSAMRDEGPSVIPEPGNPVALIGEQLSSVIFVQDYLQLDFDGPRLTVFCPVSVRTPGGASRSNEQGFRDRICEPIGSLVRKVLVSETTFALEFDVYRIEFSLVWEEHACPEPLIFSDPDGWQTVFAWANRAG